MKKYLFIFTFLSSSFYCFSQFNKYYRFPDSNAVWNESYYAGSPCYTTWEFSNYIKNDTIVNGKVYQVVDSVGGYEFGSCPPFGSLWQNYDYKVGCIRQDTIGHVYICCTHTLGSKDSLLYDFNLKVGDTLPDTYINKKANGYYVSAIDSILIGSTYRKQFIIATDTGSNFRKFDSLIEGIGSMEGLLQNLIPPFEFGYYFNCFHYDSLFFEPTLWPYDSSCSRFVLAVPSVQQPFTSIKVFPNPATAQLNVQLTNINGKVALTLYNVLGQQVMTTASEGMNTVTLNVSNLSTGLYILKAQPENGEAIMQKVEIER